eukprot:Clim_evm37s6 gene=Clim_evmTU37s6
MPDQTTKDLQNERAKATFNSRELTYVLDGGRENTEKIERIRRLVETDPVFYKLDRIFKSRKEHYVNNLAKVKRALELRFSLGMDEEEWKIMFKEIDEPLPTTLHELAFLPTLRAQCDEEQYEEWVPRSERYEIIGSYAQTELAHGSNVRGLQTTATFIPETDEIELNTPELSAAKWWPGSMGRTANFTIVYAQLIVGAKNYGVHPFILQIRDFETHRAMPGIRCFDMGPKMGMSTIDNGCLIMDHVRIPRRQMLMKFSKLEADGTYVLPPHAKLAYGTMTEIRAGIVKAAGYELSKGVTIAVRYSAVRRQGYIGESQIELQVIDYKTQQWRVFPQLASAYALKFTGDYMMEQFHTMYNQMMQGNVSMLPETHASSAGLKSITTRMAGDGLEQLRRACGGAGYLRSSGIADLVGDYAGNITAEGEAYLLPQQTTRFLIKLAQGLAAGKVKKVPESAAYLAAYKPGNKANENSDVRSIQFLRGAYGHRAARLVADLSRRMQKSVQSGKTFEEANIENQWEVIEASDAHCMALILESFSSRLQSMAGDLRAPVKPLFDLFALYHIEKDLGQFMKDGYLSLGISEKIRNEIRNIMNEIRPNAVALVDAFNFSDFGLNTAIGKYDGRPYEGLFLIAQKEPLNQTDVVVGYEEHLSKIIKQQLFSPTGNMSKI